MASPELLDVDGAAEYLGVPIVFVRRLVLEKRIAYHKLGKYLRFKPADLDAFVEQGRIEAAAGAAAVGRREIQQKSNSPLMKNVGKGFPRRTSAPS
jgi:excisionase family DNA binding protein